MLNVNRKKLKPYGDRLDDGSVQLSFTLPVPASPEAKEAARLYAEKLGFEKVSVATMEPMGNEFTFFVVYGSAKHTIDITKIHVPKVDVRHMDYSELKVYMEDHLSHPIVVVGGAVGADAHTVGIDAIMNMKGFAGDYGLERYPLFKAHNLRSQIANEELIEKAIALKADAILISQVVTQRDSHIKNLKAFMECAKKDKRLSKGVILIVGGPRIDHALALKLGYDAGFGTGTKPSQVASFIVVEHMKRKGISEKKPVAHEHRPTPTQAAEAPAHAVSEPVAPRADAHPQHSGNRKFRRRRRRRRGKGRWQGKHEAQA
jgi:beta-lysine 5,6-aminomutase beta subunit